MRFILAQPGLHARRLLTSKQQASHTHAAQPSRSHTGVMMQVQK